MCHKMCRKHQPSILISKKHTKKGSFQVSLSQAKADPCIAWASYYKLFFVSLKLSFNSLKFQRDNLECVCYYNLIKCDILF